MLTKEESQDIINVINASTIGGNMAERVAFLKHRIKQLTVEENVSKGDAQGESVKDKKKNNKQKDK